MNGFLLDTNVLSELRKDTRCDAGLRDWIGDAATEELFVSVLVFGEIRQGIERIRTRDQAQARSLEKWLSRLSRDFSDRILAVDQRVADRWGRLGLKYPVPILDGLIAATALVYELTVVSRDEAGFRATSARLINPFSNPKPSGK